MTKWLKNPGILLPVIKNASVFLYIGIIEQDIV